MKNLLALAAFTFLFLCQGVSFAIVTIPRRADNITSGILPNARLDNSSVTKKGNDFDLSNTSTTKRGQLSDGTAEIDVGSMSATDFTSTNTVKIAAVQFPGQQPFSWVPDPTVISTFTIKLRGGGDVAVATSPTSAVAGAIWTNERDTFTITGISCYTFNSSTVAATIFNVVRSTEIGSTSFVGTTVHSSSFTVATNTKYSAWIAPDNISVINANESLMLWITSVAGSGDPASEFGCRVRGWYKKQ